MEFANLLLSKTSSGLGAPEIIILLVIGAVFAYITGNGAKKKGYSFGLFCVIGFFLGLLALIIVALLPDKNKEALDAIVEYKKLLDEGIITQAEFDAKKFELMGR